ncbi:dynein axonemal heavy chain 7-like [Chrysoperla carnea]|uniref:dynein axonemal heavy chain 7-like n=1 Tax=Chrysoperla carnea TaxID=189513 RepID=UPI001D085670|nr:dynein axonemal heavy chain 7-like [Chrysoperla carnea]
MSDPNKRRISTEYTLISSPVLTNLKKQLQKTTSINVLPKPYEVKRKKQRRKIQLDPQLYAKEQLRLLAFETPEGHLDKRTEKRIKKLIPTPLCEQFPPLFSNLFRSIQDEYGKFIKTIAAEQKIVTEAPQIVPITINDYGIKFSNDELIERKAYLERRLFITTLLMRSINYKSCTQYLETLIEFDSYRDNSKSIQIAVLRARIREDLENGKSQTIHLLCKHTNSLIESKKLPKFVDIDLMYVYSSCVKHFLSLKIMESLYRTVENFIHVLHKPEKVPLLKFQLQVTNELELIPNCGQVLKFYHSLIEIFGIHEMESNQLGRLKIEIPMYLSEWAHQEIDISIENLVKPLQDHIVNLDATYSQFWNDEYINDLKNYYKNHTFEQCSEKFLELQTFKTKVTQLFPYEYFQIGILEQTSFIETIQRKLSICIENVLNSLVLNNFETNQNICKEFKTIAQKASKISDNTEDLMNMNKFMLHVKNERIHELRKNVENSMLQATELLSMTTINPEHIALNSKTIVWTRRIDKILEKNTVMFEQRKNELEEEMQKQIDELTRDVQHFANNLQILDDMSDCTKTGTYVNHLKKMRATIEIFDKKQKWINHEEVLFKFPPSTFTDLEDCKDIIYTFTDLIMQCHSWLRTYSVFMNGPWENLSYEYVLTSVEKYKETFMKYQKQYNTKIRQQITDNVARRFKGMVDDPDFHNHPAPLKLCTTALKYLTDFEPNIEKIRILCNPALLQRHWDEMSVVIERDITPNAGTTLDKVIKENLQPYLEQFDIISVAAMKELKLQENLHIMKEQWETIAFETQQWKQSELMILYNLDKIYTILDDHIIQTLTMRGSVFVKPVENEVRIWYETLLEIRANIEIWYRLQNNWLHLIPVLTCDYISCELPDETEWFQTVDGQLRMFLETVKNTQNVAKITTNIELNRQLLEINILLDKINNGINTFIDEKRLYFSRFFFLSNNEILRILSYSKCITKLIPFVRKCFENVHSMKITDNVIESISSEFETIQLKTPIVRKDFSVWTLFRQIEDEICETIKQYIYKASQDHYFMSRLKWFQKWPQQVILIVSKFNWTKECETCLTKTPKNLITYKNDLGQQLNELTQMLHSNDLTFQLKLKLVELYAQKLHNQSIIDYLIENEIDCISSFYWMIQFRYYWDQKDVHVRLLQIDRCYQYEYLGVKPRLVQTPNTERCYRTFMAAFQFQLYGCLESAEISGKTETFHDLSKIFAVQYKIYNCRANLEYDAVIRFIKGTVSSGAWFCFDDFNYTELGVLSVLAQFLKNISQAIRLNTETVNIHDKSLKMKHSCFIGVTLAWDYPRNIPDNLRLMFRNFYICEPDKKIVCETLLASYGFTNYQNLSRKLLLLYDYCAEMFHAKLYDFQIRSLKAILVTSGRWKIEHNFNGNEYQIILTEIIKRNIPQLNLSDIPRFENLLKEIFPNLELNYTSEEDRTLIESIEKICIEKQITLTQDILRKFVQLYWLIENNHGILLTGDAFSAKSVSLDVIRTLLNEHPAVIIEGICAQIYNRKQTKNQVNEEWIIYDGPIENIWFNFLYPALDSCGQICLQCAETILKTDRLINIFETSNIENLSPNIISRCGIICFDTVQWKIIFESWIKQVNPLWGSKYVESITDMVNWIIPPCLEFIRAQKGFHLYLSDTNLIRSTLILMEMILNDACNENMEDIKHVKGVWKYWPDIIKSPKIEEINLSEQIVPTLNSARQMYLLEMHIRHKNKFLLISDTGCGKTRYVKDLLTNKLPKNDFEKTYIHLTRKMSSHDAIDLFLSKFEKLTSSKYGASPGKTRVAFVDDIHLSIRDESASQAPIELIRQYFDHQFWYSEKENRKITIQNVLFIGAIGFIGGQLPNICQRFLHHFTPYILPMIENDSLEKIFSCILFHNMKDNGFPTDIVAIIMNIIQVTNIVYTKIRTELKATPNTSTYMFNLYDFEKLIRGYSLFRKSSMTSKKMLPRLWVHEMLRVFSDRLATDHKEWLREQLIEPLQEYFKDDFQTIYESSDHEIINTVCYSEILRDPRCYKETSISDFEKVLITQLENFNLKNNQKLDLTVQNYTAQHFVRICRILSHAGGSALLIGQSGSGRESLIRLAASVFEYNLYVPDVKPNYNFDDWRQNIKQVLLQVGGLGKKTIFLIKEHHLKDDNYLYDIHSLLTLGEVQNMYTIEELQKILETTRVAAQKGNRSLDVSVTDIMDFYVTRCRENLHIFICLSPKSKKLRDYLQSCPALLKTCTINYFDEWPPFMYQNIAENMVSSLNLTTELKSPLPNAFRIFDSTMRKLSNEISIRTNIRNNITSGAYMDFLKCYKTLMNKKQKEIMDARQKYQMGLDKLSFATEQVVLLQNELATLKPQLIQMGERAAEMGKVIEQETIAVEKASQLVREEEKIANVQAAAAQSLKSECEADLALAIPILEDAINALNTLKPTDITLVKSMKNPPDTIKLVMAAVCVIKEIKPDRLPDAATGKKIIDYWGPSKRILGEMNFLQQLKEFDKDNIPPTVMVKIRKEYLPNKDFQPHIVAKASSAAEGLCKWVIAMDLYDKVAKEVAPKKAKLMIAENKYANTLSILNEKRRKFSELKERLEALNRQLAEANRDMKRVQDEVDICTKKYQCAQKLVNSLESEKSYWTSTVDALKKAYDYLIGDLLFSSCIIAYMGPFSWKNREMIFIHLRDHLIELKIEFSDNFNFARLLKDKSSKEVVSYKIRNITTDNKTIIHNTNRRCLLIDPQLQMYHWIQTVETNLEIVKITDQNIMETLTQNLKIGRPMLISNLKLNVDVALMPYLCQNFYERDNQTYLNVNATEIPFNPDFRLYLTTTLPNPQYNDEYAIDTLDRSKIELKITQQDQITTDNELNNIEIILQEYKPVSVHGATVYKCLLSLYNLNYMYQYSLRWYMNLFETSISKAPKSKLLPKRIENLIENFAKTVFNNISRSLFSKDALLFSFLLYLSLEESFLKDKEWEKFVTKRLFLQFPSEWDQKLKLFEKLILIKVLLPECTLNYLKIVVSEELGNNFVIPPLYNIERTYQSSYNTKIIVILTTPDVDPVISVQKFALKMGLTTNFETICFAPEWMPKLEMLCENFKPNPNFRLWLITDMTEHFPTYILQNCTKVTIDTQDGFKETLIAGYNSDLIGNTDYYNQCPGYDKMFRRAIYSLCYFHAMVKERQRYGQLAWTYPVKFNNFDLNISLRQLSVYIRMEHRIPFLLMNYLISNCNYGGKTVNFWDQRCLTQLLNQVFNVDIIKYDLCSFYDNQIEYRVPRKLEHFDVINHINNIPKIQPPEIYWLNQNDETVKNLKELNSFIHNIYLVKNYQNQSRSLNNKINETISETINSIPKLDQVIAIKSKFYNKLTNDSFSDLVYGEMLYFEMLLEIMIKDLHNLKRALNGSITLTDELNVIFERFQMNYVPIIWLNIAMNSKHTYLGDFIQNVKRRFDYFWQWYENETIPKIFDLTIFFLPKKLLYTIIFEYALKSCLPIEQISLDFRMDVDNTDSYYSISGLYIIGACWNWDTKSLDYVKSGNIYTEMPNISVVPIQEPVVVFDMYRQIVELSLSEAKA